MLHGAAQAEGFNVCKGEPIFIYILRVEAWNVTFRTPHAFGVIRRQLKKEWFSWEV